MVMKHVLGLLLIQWSTLFSFGQSSAHQYTPSDQGSSVTFTIKNMGFNTGGSFSGLQGVIIFDPQNTDSDSFDVSVSAASVNTGNDMRDDHLKKESYFDADHYPRIHFVSTSVKQTDKNGHYTVTGKLTIKNTTKDISFPFLAVPAGDDYIFKGGFPLNRRDFDIGGSSTISGSLTVSLAILARK